MVVIFLVGIFFGIVITQAEALSWYRIQEMFLLQSFHMYGFIGSAVLLGVVFFRLVRAGKIRGLHGEKLAVPDKDSSWQRNVYGGLAFGAGWALTGTCPGPMFILLGHFYPGALVMLAFATLGAFAYGALKPYLPHGSPSIPARLDQLTGGVAAHAPAQLSTISSSPRRVAPRRA